MTRLTFVSAKQGISKRFLSYLQTFDTTVGAKVIGPEQTISGKVQQTLQGATVKAKELDEVQGISKTAGNVRTNPLNVSLVLTYRQVLPTNAAAPAWPESVSSRLSLTPSKAFF